VESEHENRVQLVFAAAALLVGITLVATDKAGAEGLLPGERAYGGCVAPCGAYLVPAPNPIPLRRLKVVPVPAVPAPCGVGCANAVNAYAAPVPCGQAGCGTSAVVYYPTRYYAYWKQPVYTACFPGPGNCYWRRNCWYDSFGRRFCN
jgi:hypothetical protein